jgi:hypothetical protein
MRIHVASQNTNTDRIFIGNEIPLSNPMVISVSNNVAKIRLESPIELKEDNFIFLTKKRPNFPLIGGVDIEGFHVYVQTLLVNADNIPLARDKSLPPTLDLSEATMSLVAIETVKFRGNLEEKIEPKQSKSEVVQLFETEPEIISLSEAEPEVEPTLETKSEVEPASDTQNDSQERPVSKTAQSAKKPNKKKSKK